MVGDNSVSLLKSNDTGHNVMCFLSSTVFKTNLGGKKKDSNTGCHNIDGNDNPKHQTKWTSTTTTTKSISHL